MGVIPGEFDLASSASPDQVIETARLRHWQVIPVGKAFGVVRVRFRGQEFEVATFRAEGGYQDARHPDASDLRFDCSLEEDVVRRDFTMNGLALDPLAKPVRVLDFVGGLGDIQGRLVRAIGDPETRFTEDALRPLRALRFSAVLGFEIDGATFAAMKKLAPILGRVSAERISHELEKAFGRGDPQRALALLLDSDILQVLFPDLGSPLPPSLSEVLKVGILGLQRGDGLEQFLALLALARHQLNPGPEQARETVQGYCLGLKGSRETSLRGRALVEVWFALRDLPLEGRRGHLLRLFRREAFPPALRLYTALAPLLGDAHPARARQFANLFQAQGPKAQAQQPLLNGADLIALGLKPSPQFSVILEELELLQLEGVISTREEALAQAKRLAQGTTSCPGSSGR
jgi:poly(A) polymerase